MKLIRYTIKNKLTILTDNNLKKNVILNDVIPCFIVTRIAIVRAITEITMASFRRIFKRTLSTQIK